MRKERASEIMRSLVRVRRSVLLRADGVGGGAKEPCQVDTEI